MNHPAPKDGVGDRTQRLIASIDNVLGEHGPHHPELVRDLQALREELQMAIRLGRTREIASTALKVAAWVKFVYDLWRPD